MKKIIKVFYYFLITIKGFFNCYGKMENYVESPELFYKKVSYDEIEKDLENPSSEFYSETDRLKYYDVLIIFKKLIKPGVRVGRN